MDSKIFIPSKRFGYILGTILLLVLILSLFNFPMNLFSLGGLDQKMIFKIGWPVPFFEVDILNIETMPIKWTPLILSLLGYFFVSYVIDIIISLIIMGLKKPEQPQEILIQARKAYFYYKSQGMEESKIRDLFKQKGWKDEDIDKLK